MLERKAAPATGRLLGAEMCMNAPKGPRGSLSIGRDMLEIADCIASSGPYNGLRDSGVPEPELFEFVPHT